MEAVTITADLTPDSLPGNDTSNGDCDQVSKADAATERATTRAGPRMRASEKGPLLP